MSTMRAANEGQTCKSCLVPGDGEICQTFEITNTGGNRNSGINYVIAGNNFDEVVSEMPFDSNSCSEDAKEQLKTEMSSKLTDQFADWLYAKPYVPVAVGDKFEICALMAVTVEVHDGCCDTPAGINLNVGEGEVNKK